MGVETWGRGFGEIYTGVVGWHSLIPIILVGHYESRFRPGANLAHGPHCQGDAWALSLCRTPERKGGGERTSRSIMRVLLASGTLIWRTRHGSTGLKLQWRCSSCTHLLSLPLSLTYFLIGGDARKEGRKEQLLSSLSRPSTYLPRTTDGRADP